MGVGVEGEVGGTKGGGGGGVREGPVEVRVGGVLLICGVVGSLDD